MKFSSKSTLNLLKKHEISYKMQHKISYIEKKLAGSLHCTLKNLLAGVALS